jgi:hypothetical protein
VSDVGVPLRDILPLPSSSPCDASSADSAEVALDSDGMTGRGRGFVAIAVKGAGEKEGVRSRADRTAGFNSGRSTRFGFLVRSSRIGGGIGAVEVDGGGLDGGEGSRMAISSLSFCRSTALPLPLSPKDPDVEGRSRLAEPDCVPQPPLSVVFAFSVDVPVSLAPPQDPPPDPQPSLPLEDPQGLLTATFSAAFAKASAQEWLLSFGAKAELLEDGLFSALDDPLVVAFLDE